MATEDTSQMSLTPERLRSFNSFASVKRVIMTIMVFLLAMVMRVTMTNHHCGVLVGNDDDTLLSTHRSQLAAMEGSRNQPNCNYSPP